MVILPSPTNFFLREVYIGPDDDGNEQIKYSRWPILAWRINDDDEDTYTQPVVGGIIDARLTTQPEDGHYYAIEHPDGSLASWTGAWHADLEAWQAEIAAYERERKC